MFASARPDGFPRDHLVGRLSLRVVVVFARRRGHAVSRLCKTRSARTQKQRATAYSVATQHRAGRPGTPRLVSTLRSGEEVTEPIAPERSEEPVAPSYAPLPTAAPAAKPKRFNTKRL